jgi:uncharacterized iron-regulated membrane protein
MTVNQARRLQTISRWHRRIAVVVMAWLALLAGSGILVNHAHDWGLDSKPLAAPLQHWIYGIEGDGADYCGTFPFAGSECSGIFATLDLPEGQLLLGEHSLFLLDSAGHLLEKISVRQTGLHALEGGLVQGEAVYLRGAATTVLTGPDLFEFRALETYETEELAGADWRQSIGGIESLTWERFVLDLHAARFLGPFSKAFNDIMAGLILLLAVSGGWIYRLKKRTNGN